MDCQHAASNLTQSVVASLRKLICLLGKSARLDAANLARAELPGQQEFLGRFVACLKNAVNLWIGFHLGRFYLYSTSALLSGSHTTSCCASFWSRPLCILLQWKTVCRAVSDFRTMFLQSKRINSKGRGKEMSRSAQTPPCMGSTAVVEGGDNECAD